MNKRGSQPFNPGQVVGKMAVRLDPSSRAKPVITVGSSRFELAALRALADAVALRYLHLRSGEVVGGYDPNGRSSAVAGVLYVFLKASM